VHILHKNIVNILSLYTKNTILVVKIFLTWDIVYNNDMIIAYNVTILKEVRNLLYLIGKRMPAYISAGILN